MMNRLNVMLIWFNLNVCIRMNGTNRYVRCWHNVHDTNETAIALLKSCACVCTCPCMVNARQVELSNAHRQQQTHNYHNRKMNWVRGVSGMKQPVSIYGMGTHSMCATEMNGSVDVKYGAIRIVNWLIRDQYYVVCCVFQNVLLLWLWFFCRIFIYFPFSFEFQLVCAILCFLSSVDKKKSFQTSV